MFVALTAVSLCGFAFATVTQPSRLARALLAAATIAQTVSLTLAIA